MNLFIYRYQYLTLGLILSLLTFQYSIIMSDHGVSTSVSLAVYSFSQALSFCSTYILSKVASRVDNHTKNRLIQISFLLRTIFSALLLIVDSDLFVIIYLLHCVASTVGIIHEGLVGVWSMNEKKDYGKIKLFASIGYSISGLVASLLFLITLNTDILIVFILISTLTLFIGSVCFPVTIKNEEKSDTKETKIKFNKEITALLIICVIAILLPNAFGVLLNDHYISIFGLSLEQAVFVGGLAVLIGSGVSEVFCFYHADKFVKKYSPRNIIFIGLVCAVLRWSIAFVTDSYVIFTLTYLFHGLCFSVIYLGLISYVKDSLGLESVSQTIIKFALYSSVATLILTAFFPIILKEHTTTFIIGIFIAISVVLLILFSVLIKKPKSAVNE